MTIERQSARTRAILRSADANRRALWCAYLNCGGGSGYVEFEAYLYGALTPPPLEELVLEQTLWEIRQFGISRW